uniref:Uncharacterized protein n=1 Tax=viral metagenome TaxID=1070528 RepID=A0A6M3IUD1_9ZZZZ
MSGPIVRLDKYSYDCFDTIEIRDGWDALRIPDLTRGNLVAIIGKVDELVEAVNRLMEHEGEGGA